MKTERFDEAFRRKLLGLPAEADPGEVERIHGFVNANNPALPSWGWGKLLLYGGSSLLLLGSLSYNVIQTYRNTHLQSSIDSLTQRPVDPVASRNVIRHDTVYITRSGNNIESTSLPGTSAETPSQKPLKQAHINQTTATRPVGSVAMERSKLSKPGLEVVSNRVEAVSPRSGSKSTKPTTVNTSTVLKQPREGRELYGKVQTETNKSVASLPPVPVSVARSTEEKERQANGSETPPTSMPTETKLGVGNLPTGRLLPATPASSHRSTTGRQTSSDKRQLVSINERKGLLTTNYSRKRNQRTIYSTPTTEFSPATVENPNSTRSVSVVNRQQITAEPLAILKTGTTSNPLSIISPSRPLIVPKSELSVKATRRWGHLAMPRLSVPNAQYRIGGGLTGSSDQVGGALLGEIMLNRHWSVQTGLQLAYNSGFHYRDEQEFDEHEKENFRQTYASQVPSSSDIEDIKQMSRLVQVPIQVAYHYSLGRHWGLRLGLGTNLTVWTHSTLNYSYRENSRSYEHGSSLIEEPTYFFNNLTLSAAVERSWKKWLFRAGPFISPQLRQVGYKSDDLFWGANVQVLYRMSK